MKDKIDESLLKSLSVYKLPEADVEEQPLIDRAEEDLLCAVFLYYRASGYLPSTNICFLLHQAIEKWLKLLIALLVEEGTIVGAKGQHDLYNRFIALEKIEPAFLDIRNMIEQVDGKILGRDFPGDLRYEEDQTEIASYVQVLMPAAFATRRLAKQCLKRRTHEQS